QAAGRDVGRSHARGIVDHQNIVPALTPTAVKANPEHGVNHEQDDEHLEHEQNVLAQPLKQAVDMQILDAFLPQERARHLERLALQLEKVKQDDGQRQQQG